jgi:hypothetical protein
MKSRTFTKRLSIFLMVSMLLLTFNSAFDVAAAPAQLKDITDSYAQKEIQSLVDDGIISGYEDGSFQPRKTITRAELAKIIVLSLGLKENPSQAAAFTDVDKNSWYRGFVGALVESRITQGNSDTTFAPDSKVTREELAVFFVRALGLEEIAGKLAVDAKVSDLNMVSSWAQAHVSLAFKVGFIQGIGNSDGTVKFSPKENSERQAVARLAYEFKNNKSTFINRAKELANGSLRVSSVTAPNSTTVEVTFSSAVTAVAAADFTFNNGLIVTKAEMKPGSPNVVILTTSTQTPGTVYTLSYLGKDTGTNSTGYSSGSGSTGTGSTGGSSNNGNSNNGNNNSGGNTPDPVVLAAPTNLVAIAGNSQIQLTWSSVTGATYYQVYQSPDNVTYQMITTPTSVTTNTYVVTGLTNGTSYYFKTAATNTVSVSTYSNIVNAIPSSTVPAKPTLNTAAVAIGANVTINAPSGGVTAWLAPAGTTVFTTGPNMTNLVGNAVATTIAAPNKPGNYNLFLVNGVGVSAASDGILTVSSPIAVNLGTASSFVILSKTGISTVPNSVITGDIGVSPIAATAMTGFSLTPDATNAFSTSNQITGKAYASDYVSPTPSNLTTAIGDLETAYTNAAGRVINYSELHVGDLSGKTLTSGVYKWGTNVIINSDVTLDGGANDVWIFQIAGGITQASGARVILTGGAQAKNIFWQTADTVSIGTGAHMEGIILSKTNIAMGTNSSINGRLLAQTAVTLAKSTVTAP